MCGICGKIYFDSQETVDAQEIQRMCDVLKHRGPDKISTYLHRQIGLGHCRLSIIDLVTGDQPMSNRRQDIRIVFNGEIYNFPELRKDLEKRGYQFVTTSDTEVIIYLYEEYGVACVRHLRGMFAFAIWDARQQRLFLARDRVGKKPLFYYLTDRSLAFASEIKSLLQDAALTPEINLTAMHHYLTYQYVPPPDTMFQHVYKLPPAHTLICEQGKIALERYWDLRYVPKLQMDAHELTERVTELIHESVKMRMISDVPIGAFLSGGIDSSLIVALMAQYSQRPVKTFSIGFREKTFNELPYARLIAERYHTEHYECIVEPNAVEVLPKLIWHFDEPFGDSSAIPTYYVAQMTSQHVKVALNGDGGDESFAGYLRYLGQRVLQYYHWLPSAVRKHVCAPLLAMCYQHRQYFPAVVQHGVRYLNYLHNLALQSPQALYASTLIIFSNERKFDLYTDDIRARFAECDSLQYMFDYLQADNTDHFTDSMLYSDVMTYLPGDLLVKMDRMAMAHSLEGRSPFLDHKLMECVAAIPPEYKLHGTQLKFLLKKIARAYLPETIISRRKQGFCIPLGEWFQHELRDMVQEAFTASSLVKDGIFRAAALQQILREHQSGAVNHQSRMWILLNLELWYRMFITHG